MVVAYDPTLPVTQPNLAPTTSKGDGGIPYSPTMAPPAPATPTPAPPQPTPGSPQAPDVFQSPLQNIAKGNSQTNLDVGQGAVSQAAKDFASAGAQNAGPIGKAMLASAPGFAKDVSGLDTPLSTPAQKQGAMNTSLAELALPAGPAAKATTDIVNPILEANKAARAISDAKAVDTLVGTITQGTSGDVAKAKATLGNIDPTGISTYKDLETVLTDKVSTISSKLDAALETNTDTKLLPNLNVTSKVGESSVSHNYVQDAIDQLKAHYQATNDVTGLAKVTQLETKANTSGLTTKEINDLAKEHGQAINAFNANGQAASGLSKQAAENTRTGVKATGREMFNNPAYKAADTQLTNLIRTRDLVHNVGEKVNQLQQKIQPRSWGEKAGRLLGQVINLAGLNSPKGLVEYFLSRGTGLKTLNALDLEAGLSKNLKNLQSALAPTASTADVEQALQNIVDSSKGKSPFLQLPPGKPLGSSEVPIQISPKETSGVKIVPAEKTLPTANPKTGRMQTTYSSTPKSTPNTTSTSLTTPRSVQPIIPSPNSISKNAIPTNLPSGVPKAIPSPAKPGLLSSLKDSMKNGQRGFIANPFKKTSTGKAVNADIHPEDLQAMHDFIDHATIKSPLTDAQFASAEKLAQKFGISMDKGISGVANEFRKVLEGQKKVGSTIAHGRDNAGRFK